jgi:hypothetical protein
MAIDSTIAIRRGILALAKGNVALNAIVPASRIYPQTTPAKPTYPFIRSGAPSVVPIRASCVDGGEWTVAMHAFALDRIVSRKVVETAEDYAGRIGAALAGALDGQIIDLAQGRASIRWISGQLLQDPVEASAFHSVQSFRVRALTA